MNFLAHFYLSDNNPELQTGNFLGDMMRKTEWIQLPPAIRLGVLQHQQIDHFTDKHSITKLVKDKFLHDQHHFSGVVSDIMWDYFLAKNWRKFHNTELDSFSQFVYSNLKSSINHFNQKGKITFEYMEKHNWLLAYSTLEGIEKIFNGMSRRSKHENKVNLAIHTLRENEDELEQMFFSFFSDLHKNTKDSVIKLSLLNESL